jgi:hypothetical protein
MSVLPNTQNPSQAAPARRIAIVMLATVLLWMGAQFLGGWLGWDPRFAFLFDLAAIAAFIWVLARTWQIWRR